MGLFSKKKDNDGQPKKSKKKGAIQNGQDEQPEKPKWADAWTRPSVDAEEVQALLRGCTLELKARALDLPFLLLPFRPTSDPSAARTFIRNYFDRDQELSQGGDYLLQELRLTEPMVLCSVVKWCWARLPGGVVTWDAYELFKVGEQDSNWARDSFATFIPLSIDSDARIKIIFDFFDLLSAIAAHGKANGLSGRKLSRYAGWWAFGHADTGNGFEGGYKGWAAAADATSHLFFAYLRSMTPENRDRGLTGISSLPMSLQKLVQETEYPPQRPELLQSATTKVVMIVDSVSPTPLALLRRANHFEYRDDDPALQEFSEFDDPTKALTEECRRVLNSISSANDSQITSNKSTGLRGASWSRFEDIGFSGEFFEENDGATSGFNTGDLRNGLQTKPMSRATGGGRPTTPSWADFLSTGFVAEGSKNPPLLLPPDKILPPIETSRGKSSQSHNPKFGQSDLEPGELASIGRLDLDDAFWWVWITSLAGEEPAERKAAFGRCAVAETIITGGKWIVLEEMVKGAASAPNEGAYIAEKKGLFSWTKRNKGLKRSKSTTGKAENDKHLRPGYAANGNSKTSIGPDHQARIQQAALELQLKQKRQEDGQELNSRRGRQHDAYSTRTNSVLTLQPMIASEASQAMKWAHKYDKDAIKEAYLANNEAGKGLGAPPSYLTNGNGRISEEASKSSRQGSPAVGSPALSRGANSPAPDRDLETAPVVPAKNATPPSAPLPPSSAVPEKDSQPALVSEKAAEVALPAQRHPMSPGAMSPTAMSPKFEQTQSRTEGLSPGLEKTQTRSESRAEQIRDPSTDVPSLTDSSPDHIKERRKLQKKTQSPGKFKQMFGRSKVRATVAEVEKMNSNNQSSLQPGGATLGRSFSGYKKTNADGPVVIGEGKPIKMPAQPTEAVTPAASTHKREFAEPTYNPSVNDDQAISRVDTNDAEEANQAFSSFDQGPLEDQPAFAAESPVKEHAPAQNEFSTPSERVNAKLESTAEEAEPTRKVSPPAPQYVVSDHWSKVRQEAAARKAATAARQSEDQSRGAASSRDSDGNETSGEETIESRVARIKARVAELTGNINEPPAPYPVRSPRQIPQV